MRISIGRCVTVHKIVKYSPHFVTENNRTLLGYKSLINNRVNIYKMGVTTLDIQQENKAFRWVIYCVVLQYSRVVISLTAKNETTLLYLQDRTNIE